MSAVVQDLVDVIAAGRQSRAELAAELAGQFRRDPVQFEPRSLERLGAEGLQRFLAEAVGDGRLPGPSQPSVRNPPTLPRWKTAPASGWRHLRRSEWPIWITGVAAGLRAGAVVTGAGLFILFSAERVAPVLRELLP